MKNRTFIYFFITFLMFIVIPAIAAEAQEDVIPEGFILQEVTVGDVSYQYLENEQFAYDAADLAEIAPAAGQENSTGKFVGPRRTMLYNEVWATDDTE